MWMEEYSTSKGIRYRFSERYTNPLTGKLCKVSVSKNAVAPDWNLKIYHFVSIVALTENAVAPDWNLKALKAAVSSGVV